MPQTLRTFIAVELDLAVRKRALDLVARLSPTDAKVSWTKADNLHFTLQFLGEVPVEDTVRICQALEPVIAPLPPFEIEVRGAGAFPSNHAPRILWLGVQNGRDGMTILHEAIARTLVPFGIRDEDRRYRPHVTLGRVRGPRGGGELGRLIDANANFLAGTMHVEEVIVFSSSLTPGGAEYEALATLELGG